MKPEKELLDKLLQIHKAMENSSAVPVEPAKPPEEKSKPVSSVPVKTPTAEEIQAMLKNQSENKG